MLAISGGQGLGGSANPAALAERAGALADATGALPDEGAAAEDDATGDAIGAGENALAEGDGDGSTWARLAVHAAAAAQAATKAVTQIRMVLGRLLAVGEDGVRRMTGTMLPCADTMSLRAFASIGLLAMAACRVPRATPAQTIASPPVASAASTPPTAPPAAAPNMEPAPVSPCVPGAGVIVRIPDAQLECADEFRQCSVDVPIEIWSCDEPVVVDHVELPFKDGGTMLVEFADPKVAAAQALRRTFTVSWEREYVAVAHYQGRGESPMRTAETRFRVTNPKRDAAIEACKGCDGEWSSWGMTGWEGCNCRMKDGGKVCHDGDECEGRCMFERFEVVSKPSGPTCRGGVCTASFGLGVPVGRCSEYRMVFGCKAMIGAGESKRPPRRLPGHAPTTCVD